MASIVPFIDLFNMHDKNLEPSERLLLEAFIFYNVYEHLKQRFAVENKKYIRLLKLTKEEEAEMISNGFIQATMDQIMMNGDYTIEGIARYTDTHLDIVVEIYHGRCMKPSADFLYRLVGLHYQTHREDYADIFKKIVILLRSNDVKKDANDCT